MMVLDLYPPPHTHTFSIDKEGERNQESVGSNTSQGSAGPAA